MDLIPSRGKNNEINIAIPNFIFVPPSQNSNKKAVIGEETEPLDKTTESALPDDDYPSDSLNISNELQPLQNSIGLGIDFNNPDALIAYCNNEEELLEKLKENDYYGMESYCFTNNNEKIPIMTWFYYIKNNTILGGKYKSKETDSFSKELPSIEEFKQFKENLSVCQDCQYSTDTISKYDIKRVLLHGCYQYYKEKIKKNEKTKLLRFLNSKFGLNYKCKPTYRKESVPVLNVWNNYCQKEWKIEGKK